MYKFTTSINMYSIFGVILKMQNITKRSQGSHVYNTGCRADCSHFMVSEKCINTSNVSDYNCGYSSKDTWWPDAF